VTLSPHILLTLLLIPGIISVSIPSTSVYLNALASDKPHEYSEPLDHLKVQIQQYPNYAYDKDLVIYEQTRDRLSISSSFEIFGKWIVDSIAPWQEKKDNISFLKDR